MNEDVRFYSEALIGAAEAMLDRGTLSEGGENNTREIIKRLRRALASETTPPPVVVVTVRGGLVEEVEARQPVTVLTIDHDTDGAGDGEFHTLPDGQQVLTSLTAATISDLSDYRPLLAHLPNRAPPAELCGCGEANCACEHRPHEDCMNCSECGACWEDLNDDDTCSGCREEPDEEKQPTPAEPATPGE